MAANLYFIKCLTNLHVGSGDVNFNIIDNEVEKDPITGYPMINGSGVKGALRQFFEKKDSDLAVELFGSPVRGSQKNNSGSTPGRLKILPASLLARPVRSSAGSKAFYMATTKTAMDQFCATILPLSGEKVFEIEGVDPSLDYTFSDKSCVLEGYKIDKRLDLKNNKNLDAIEYLKGCIGPDLAILSDETLRKVPLPVMARNQLENGESKNLWYEEMVPHESVFWFMALGDDVDLEFFDEVVNGQVVQFGGNASIGCGLCKVWRKGD